MPAASFNELFGLGSHAGNHVAQGREGWWPLMDNAANTTVTDYSGRNRNSTLINAGNTSSSTDTGPNSWATSSMRLDGSNDHISLPLSSLGGDDATMLALLVVDSDPAATAASSGLGMFGQGVVSSNGSHWPWIDGVVYDATWRGTSSTTTSRVTVGNPTPSLTAWRKLCVKTTPGAGGWRHRIDESTIASSTGITGLYTGGNWNFGYSTGGGTQHYYFKGKVSHLSIWSKYLSDAEESESFAGPEPINSVAPVASGTATQGQTLSCTTGTWGLGSPFSGGTNGTITCAYQWTRSDDGSGTGEANIGGATSSTYALQAADVGKYIRCYVAATNDGGRDVAADTPSDFTGAIAGAATGVARRKINRSLAGVSPLLGGLVA